MKHDFPKLIEQLSKEAKRKITQKRSSLSIADKVAFSLMKFLLPKLPDFHQVVKHCEISGIPLEEALRYVVTVVPYGSRTKKPLQDLLLKQNQLSIHKE